MKTMLLIRRCRLPFWLYVDWMIIKVKGSGEGRKISEEFGDLLFLSCLVLPYIN